MEGVAESNERGDPPSDLDRPTPVDPIDLVDEQGNLLPLRSIPRPVKSRIWPALKAFHLRIGPHVLVRGIVAAGNVVPGDIESKCQTRCRITVKQIHVLTLYGRLLDLGRLASAAIQVVGFPRQRHSPAPERLRRARNNPA